MKNLCVVLAAILNGAVAAAPAFRKAFATPKTKAAVKALGAEFTKAAKETGLSKKFLGAMGTNEAEVKAAFAAMQSTKGSEVADEMVEEALEEAGIELPPMPAQAKVRPARKAHPTKKDLPFQVKFN